MVFWALVIIISIKYIFFVMRADNRGEGGILALTALVMPTSGGQRVRPALSWSHWVCFGTALLYGDGLITPAISVLGAVEGFEVAFPAFGDYLVPLACVHPGRLVLCSKARHWWHWQGLRSDHDRLVHRCSACLVSARSSNCPACSRQSIRCMRYRLVPALRRRTHF